MAFGIGGTILNKNGYPVENAVINIYDQGTTNLVFTTLSDEDGNYIVNANSSATYDVEVIIDGVSNVTTGVSGSPGSTTYVNMSVNTSVPNQPPVADAGEDIIVDEGETAQFDGTNSFDLEGEIIEYKWTFDGITLYGPTPTYTWYDNYFVTVTLTVTTLTIKAVPDGEGGVTYVYIYQTASDTLTVTVLNVDPEVTIDEGFMLVDFTLRVAGEKWHDVYFTLYEGPMPIAALHVERYPGDPDEQSDTVYDVYIDMGKRYYFECTYNPYEDDNPINGQLNGGNPIWVNLTFEDESWELIHHTFNYQQSIDRDSDHWLHVEPWWIDLSPYFVGHVATWKATATDVGTDDEVLTWNWGDGTPNTITTHRWDGSNPDGGSTPYDLSEGSYPMTVYTTVYHTYMYEGDFIVTLTCDDDDSGMDDDTFDVEAIHTDHDHPTI
jgi:hypothetical protein